MESLRWAIIIIIYIDANDDGGLPLVVGDTYQQAMVYDPHLPPLMISWVNILWALYSDLN